VIGDHVPYVGGKLAGPRLLGLYCRLTLGSERCVERTVAYFKRFGTAAIVLSRFSTSIRLFASALSGCGHITYRKFIVFDVIGTLMYAALWSALGFAIGDRAEALLERYGPRLLLVAPVAGATLLAYRLWRRSRYGPAQPADLKSGEACTVLEPARR
jgi:membrane protein DedA with SNARE-associated domain